MGILQQEKWTCDLCNESTLDKEAQKSWAKISVPVKSHRSDEIKIVCPDCNKLIRNFELEYALKMDRVKKSQGGGGGGIIKSAAEF